MEKIIKCYQCKFAEKPIFGHTPSEIHFCQKTGKKVYDCDYCSKAEKK